MAERQLGSLALSKQNSIDVSQRKKALHTSNVSQRTSIGAIQAASESNDQHAFVNVEINPSPINNGEFPDWAKLDAGKVPNFQECNQMQKRSHKRTMTEVNLVVS
jgi:hypothetical protein